MCSAGKREAIAADYIRPVSLDRADVRGCDDPAEPAHGADDKQLADVGLTHLGGPRPALFCPLYIAASARCPLRAVRSLLSDEKKLSSAALSQALLDRFREHSDAAISAEVHRS